MATTVRRTDEGRVAVLALDHPDHTMNVVDERLLADLDTQLRAVLEDDAVAGVVLASAKDGSFGAGADVAWLPELAARDDAEAFLAEVHQLMLRMVRSPKPIVAAIDGPAFGGALELALGAGAIVATPGATFGLPEVGLGLLPGGGGTQLLPRRVGLTPSLELVTAGSRLDASRAVELGLVAEVVDVEQMMAHAVRRADAGDLPPVVTAPDAAMAEAAVTARREELAGSRAGLSPAAETILQVMATGATEGLEAGLAAERTGFLELLRSPEARAAIHLFDIESAVKRRSRGDGPEVATLGVIGGGQMGAGIAATAVTRGLSAVVRDVEEASLQRARDYLDRVLAKRPPAEGDDPTRRWHGTTGRDGIDRADAVVEAVFELPELKAEVLTELSATVDDTTLVATNTSAISIADLATSVRHPGRFLGMHFFSPVERMPLVELIPHAGTDVDTTGRAAALGRQLGKVPVVVGDAPGFFTSRVYARWLVEGVRLLLDGVGVTEVDAAAKQVGFPVGPLQAHDEATLELVVQASITQVAEQVMADRLDVATVRRALETLIDADVVGRRHGSGFYAYEEGRRAGANGRVAEVLAPLSERSDADAEVPGSEEIGRRLLLAFVSECLLCWDDGTLCHPDDGDVAAVLGIGFPRVLGGPFHWVDEVGAEQVARDATARGSAFTVPAWLADHAGSGTRFTDQPRRPAPFTDPG